MTRILLFAAIIALVSCKSPNGGYEAQTQHLDSLRVALDESAPKFLAIHADSVMLVVSTVKDDMRQMEMLSKGQMDVETARIFSDYNSAKRLVKDFSGRNGRLTNELERTKLQLAGLTEALKSGANVDAAGNKIDDEYVKKHVSLESRIAEELIEEMNNSVRYADEAIREFNRLKSLVDQKLEAWKNE